MNVLAYTCILRFLKHKHARTTENENDPHLWMLRPWVPLGQKMFVSLTKRTSLMNKYKRSVESAK